MMGVTAAPSEGSLSAAGEVLALLGSPKATKERLVALEKATKEYGEAEAKALKAQADVAHQREALEAENKELSKLSRKLKDKEDTLRTAAAAVKAKDRAVKKERDELLSVAADNAELKDQLGMYQTQLAKRLDEINKREAHNVAVARRLVDKARQIAAIAKGE